jgi:enterochelin esterase-like enzyme
VNSNRMVSIICALFIITGLAYSQESTKIEGSQIIKDVINSEILKKAMNINIYLPSGYNKDTKYPVLYMLHGYGSNENVWIDFGLTKKADELINKKKITPMIIVMPNIDNSWGINSSKNYSTKNNIYYGMYEDYFFKEIIPYIEVSYSTDTSKKGRFIGGGSMGGFVSLYYAFKNPDLFSRVGGHSAALYPDDAAMPREGLPGKYFIFLTEDLKKQRDPLLLATEKDLTNLEVYLDCGTEDEFKFYLGAKELYDILKEKGVKVEYYAAPGRHDPAFYKSNVEKDLLFYGKMHD